VDLKTWLSTMPALVALSDDIFIADDKHIIRQDILPQAVGQAIGANYMPTPRGILEFLESNGTRTATPALAQVQAQSQEPVNVRQFPMYLTRPLDHPDGWLLGASYKSTELPKLFAAAALGFNPVAALVDVRTGNIQAVAGPSARKPRTDLSKTPLFAAMMRSAPGVWLGEAGIDDIKRLNAYRRVPNNDLLVVVGADWDEIMAPAVQLATGTRELAAAATILVITICGFALSSFYTLADRRRLRRLFHKAKEEIKRLQSDDSVNTVRTLLHAARLQTVVALASDGFAVFDGGMRLIQWNPHFEAIAVIPPGATLTLDMLVQQLVISDAASADEDAEISRRTEILRGGDPDGLVISGPEGRDLMRLRGVPLALGGCVLVLTGGGEPGLVMPPVAVRETPEPVARPPARARMDW
jgi:PAS domain-containing protein